jgi:preprotein translocase subunit SecA
MPVRSWERGLHQLIEAKEGCALTDKRTTLARLTYQRLFRRYIRLSGMTGTGAEVAREMKAVYGLDVVRIPLYRPLRRVMAPPSLHLTAEAKWRHVVEAAAAAQAAGRAVLIGTRSVAASEHVSALLNQRGVAHALLNAKQDRSEADVIAQAGRARAVTVATNMAGRGTDIPCAPDVLRNGGLHVILCQLNASARIDRQFAGRAGRQGQAGSVRRMLALDFPLVRKAWPAAWLRWLASRGSASSLANVTLGLAQRRESFTHPNERVKLCRVATLVERDLNFSRQVQP